MNDLIDRYVWAVARDLPRGQRDDVARELRATIEDMVDAHDPQDDDAVRQVLLELGDPTEPALSYAGAGGTSSDPASTRCTAGSCGCCSSSSCPSCW